MNVFDFDKTIYDGDSTADFFFFCLTGYKKVYRHIPRITANALKYKTGKMTKTAFKEDMYSFLSEIDDIDKAVERFWELNRGNLKSWYLDMKREDDLIISASPEFLLRPVCDFYGIKHLIASRVDKRTGKYTGINCDGEEKVRRFKEIYKNAEINEFYSDSESDAPLAELAFNALKVKGDTIMPWFK